MRHEKDFRYANDPTFWEKKKPADNTAFLGKLDAIFNSRAIKWILYLVLAAIVVYIIQQVITVNDITIFSRKRKRPANAAHNDELSKDDIDGLLSRAEAAGEFRLAIRYYYLQTLHHLGQLHKIKLHADATNRDYLSQMSADAGASDFQALTDVYEYVWYGEFQPSAAQFGKIASRFQHFNARR